jgi:hypothetical protein
MKLCFVLRFWDDGLRLGRGLAAANELIGGQGQPDVLPEMLVIVFTTNIALYFMGVFHNQPDIQQAWKGYLFTDL